jgi:hypothetical protein
MWHSACVAFGEVDDASPTTSIARARGININAVDSAANIASSAIVGTVVGHALGEEGVAATATADEDATAELENAIAWSTSLTRPNRPDWKRLSGNFPQRSRQT